MPSNRSVEKQSPILLLSILGILLSGALPLPAADTPALAVQGVTLKEAFERGVKVSETLQISDEEVKQLEFRYKAALGDILPRLTWNMSQMFEDTKGVEMRSSGNQDPPRKRTPESYFMVQQPLFHGFQEFNALKGFRASQDAIRYEKQQARLALLTDIANVFYGSLDLQQELDVLNKQVELTDDRIKELDRRIRLGRSRDSETLSAQVDRASLQATIEDTKARWIAARQTLRFLTEIPADQPLVETRPLPTALTAVDTALGKISQRPDVQAALQKERAADFQVQYAKAGYYPSLDLTGRYYTERVGFQKEVDWDALFFLEVPLYQGGMIRAKTAQARSQLLAQALETSRIRRMARESIETEHANLQYDLAQAKSYAVAVDLAEKNYKVQQEEYRLGLINNLQVLDVLTTLQNLKLRRLRAEAATRLSEIRLLAATGEGL